MSIGEKIVTMELSQALRLVKAGIERGNYDAARDILAGLIEQIEAAEQQLEGESQSEAGVPT